jgi:hypothetical protein
LGAAIVTATPALAFRGGGGFHGGGMHFGGGGMHMGGGPMHFGGGGRFFAAPFAGRHMFNNGFNSFGFRHHHFHDFAFRHHRHFRNFAFIGAPYAYDYGYDSSDDGCWRQLLTSYGWQWTNVCYDYGY